MARHDARPSLDLEAGFRVFEEDLARVLAVRGAAAPADLGWKVVGKRTLLVPVAGMYGGAVDTFLLRLDFVTRREWPPKAQFVDPATLAYVVGRDRSSLPQLNHPEVHVHPAYQRDPSAQKIQLICCSATFEYYDVVHGGDDAILWRSNDTFAVTIAAIQRAMASEHYLGRHPADEA